MQRLRHCRKPANKANKLGKKKKSSEPFQRGGNAATFVPTLAEISNLQCSSWRTAQDYKVAQKYDGDNSAGDATQSALRHVILRFLVEVDNLLRPRLQGPRPSRSEHVDALLAQGRAAEGKDMLPPRAATHQGIRMVSVQSFRPSAV